LAAARACSPRWLMMTVSRFSTGFSWLLPVLEPDLPDSFVSIEYEM
jgi:hypothetical protein